MSYAWTSANPNVLFDDRSPHYVCWVNAYIWVTGQRRGETFYGGIAAQTREDAEDVANKISLKHGAICAYRIKVTPK